MGILYRILLYYVIMINEPTGVLTDRSAYAGFYNDQYWFKSWFMHDYRTDGQGSVMDHNIVPVHRMGNTGKGIRVAVLAHGVNDTHADLRGQVDIDNSYALKGDSWRPDESEVLSGVGIGTRVAGVIAMAANNKICSAGVAPGARILSIKIPSSKIGSLMPSLLEQSMQSTHLYAYAARREDTGDEMKQITNRVAEAWQKVATEPRLNMGSIIVVPAGDGKTSGDDNCGADAMVNSLFTITIGSASQKGKVTPYSERCAAVMATAYSSGGPDDEKIYTTEVDGSCSSQFEGTVASMAIATGIFALVLGVESMLTLRAMMHIIALTAEVAPLADNPGTWKKNGAGFWVSNEFGFGLLNAENMVRLVASNRRAFLKYVMPPLNDCLVQFNVGQSVLEINKVATLEATTDGCPERYGNGKLAWPKVMALEQVELVVSLSYNYRGAVHISIVSPMKTKTTLLEQRVHDTSTSGLNNWRLVSVQNWGETPVGTWTVNIATNHYQLSGLPYLINQIQGITKTVANCGDHSSNRIKSVELILHGTRLPHTEWLGLTSPSGQRVVRLYPFSLAGRPSR